MICRLRAGARAQSKLICVDSSRFLSHLQPDTRAHIHSNSCNNPPYTEGANRFQKPSQSSTSNKTASFRQHEQNYLLETLTANWIKDVVNVKNLNTY